MRSSNLSAADAIAPRIPAPQGSFSPAQFQRDLVALIPNVRAFSRVLCGRRAIAEDVAQEALMKAWRARGTFQPGTNLKAWLFTILRNEFYSQGRRAWRETHLDPDASERIEAPAKAQEWALELSDTARALRRLPDRQREALILVAVGGFSYQDVAKICDAPIGTVKSRVARARATLLDILEHATSMPPDARPSHMMAADDILAQLTALAPEGATGVALT